MCDEEEIVFDTVCFPVACRFTVVLFLDDEFL